MKRVLLLLGLVACGDPASTETRVMMDYGRPTFLSAPWPSESLRREDGGIAFDGFPNPTGAPIVDHLVGLIGSEARGFSTTAGIFFSLSGPLADAEIASFDSTDAPVFLVPIQDGAVGERHPVEVRYREDGGPFGAPHVLSVLPLQGKPLQPKTLYAAVVRRALLDRDGQPLAAIGALPGNARYQEAFAALVDVDLAGLAVFETDDPTATMMRARDDVLARPLPELASPFMQTELFDTYCVYEATIPMPVYQNETGGWTLEPSVQREEMARIVVTVPRAPMPPSGFPAMLFSRTGAGGDRPLVDRGVHAEPGGEAEPGTGPALELARVGFAGVSVDGPHGGLRNVTGGDEQFLMFDVENPTALRDNVRQSALELLLQARILGELEVPDCDALGVIRFDTSRLALMGHSMGATIAPLTMSATTDFGALVLSGAGGSYIENVIHKLSPVPVRGFAELLLGVAGTWELTEHDPAVSLLQWAVEPADPPVYAHAITGHVLMLQGIVDTYILPPMANALSLALRLDLAGEPLDAGHPELAAFTPLEPLLPHSGAQRVTLPATSNVVVQHPEDGIEDGHEVVFQTDPPKRQYRCFLETFATGRTPVVCP